MNVVQRWAVKRIPATEDEVVRQKMIEEVRQEVASQVWAEATKELNRISKIHAYNCIINFFNIFFPRIS
jgi:hypothetical protein